MARKQPSKWQLPAPQDDGLTIPSVGAWSAYKHHFLSRYLHAFVTAMRNKKWTSLHYVDLFAGAGIERLKNSGKLDWGSPLIAAQVPHPFARIHACEKDRQKFNALEQRLKNWQPKSQILQGNCNRHVSEIVQDIPDSALSVAFLDPYGLHLDFKTLATLARKRVDLIIFFPDHLDALRNCRFVYHDDPNSNLDRVLGSGVDWRSSLAGAPRERWAEALRNLYSQHVRSLGYHGPELERISQSDGRFLYLLMFFSKSSVGLDIWRRVALRKPEDQ